MAGIVRFLVERHIIDTRCLIAQYARDALILLIALGEGRTLLQAIIIVFLWEAIRPTPKASFIR